MSEGVMGNRVYLYVYASITEVENLRQMFSEWI